MSSEYKKGDVIKFHRGKVIGKIAETSGDFTFLVDIAIDDYQAYKEWFNDNDCQALYHVRANEVRLLVSSEILNGKATPVEQLVYQTEDNKFSRVCLKLSASPSDAKVLLDAFKKGDLKDIAGHKILDIHFD